MVDAARWSGKLPAPDARRALRSPIHRGAPLPTGAKPFVDDGNCFWARRIPAITHGARSGGQHTVHEWVSIDDLVRLAKVYALTAVTYCA